MKKKNVQNYHAKNKRGYYSRNAIFKKIEQISNEYIPPKVTEASTLPMLEVSWYYRRIICYVCGRMVSLNKKMYWEQFNQYWNKGNIQQYVWCYKCAQIMCSFHVTDLHVNAQKYHLDVFVQQKKIRDRSTHKTKLKNTTLSYFRCCPCRYNLSSRYIEVKVNPLNFKSIPPECLKKFCLI